MPKTRWRYRANCLVPEGEQLPSGTLRYAARIEYDGSAYCGWQRQPHCQSVQALVEKALSTVAAEPITVACAGRTDSGVHATHQVIHFDSVAERTSRNWVLGANANLPRDIRCHWAAPVPADFHARFSARSRTYRYVVANRQSPPALGRLALTWESKRLSVPAMKRGARYLKGEQDFSAFRAAGCQSQSPWRFIHYVDIFRVGELVVFEVCANAFLLHMVRNIVGVLLAVGRGERPAEWVGEVLVTRDRRCAAATAPASGLYLVAVEYPAKFELPETKPGPFFISRKLRPRAQV